MRLSTLVLLFAAMLGVLGLGGFGMASIAVAQDGAAPQRVETPIVLRISKQLVVELTDKEIEFDLPVAESFGSIPIHGTVKTRSKVDVTLQTSDKTATCVLSAAGQAHAFLTASKGPVTAHSQAWIPYRLETRVTFDGIKFKAHPITARLAVTSKIDQVCTRRNGPLARCVRRIGARMIADAKPQLDEYLYDRARHKCEVELAAVARELVDELNSTNQLDEMIVEHFPEAKSWNYHVSSTDKIILAAVGPKDAVIPNLRTQKDGTMEASMDLWVRTSWEESLVIDAALLWNSTHELLKKVLPADIAKSLAEHVTLATEGNWFVVTAGRGAIKRAIAEVEK